MQIRMQIRKRSVKIANHLTSISLEDEFWGELTLIAAAKGLSLNQLIAEIDQKREGNLSSALRVFVLGELKKALFAGEGSKNHGQPGIGLLVQ